MKVKNLALTVLILGVVTTAFWFFNRDTGGPAADPRIGQPLLDKAAVEKAASVFLRSGANEVTLTNVDPAASSWVVKEYFDLPVDFSKLTKLINELKDKAGSATRFVGSKPERLEKLGFSGDRIELRDKDGKAVWTLHLGASPEKGGRFVKFDDESRAYLTGLSTYVDAIAKNWADTNLVGAKAEDVVGLEVRFPEGGSLTTTRIDSKGVWKCQDLADGETLKDSEVNSLAGKLAALRFMEAKEPVALEAVASRPSARSYKVTLADGRVFTITASQPVVEPPPVPETPPAEGAMPPPAPAAPPADVFVQSSRTEDAINALMTRRSFQVAEWTFSGLPTKRDVLVNAAPAPAPAAPAPEPAPAVAP